MITLETLVEAMNRLRNDGYTVEFRATDAGLRCDACGVTHAPEEMAVDEIVRFEGDTNPGDEAILVALTCECGARGLFTAAFGPDTSPEEAQILQALPDR